MNPIFLCAFAPLREVIFTPCLPGCQAAHHQSSHTPKPRTRRMSDAARNATSQRGAAPPRPGFGLPPPARRPNFDPHTKHFNPPQFPGVEPAGCRGCSYGEFTFNHVLMQDFALKRAIGEGFSYGRPTGRDEPLVRAWMPVRLKNHAKESALLEKINGC